MNVWGDVWHPARPTKSVILSQGSDIFPRGLSIAAGLFGRRLVKKTGRAKHVYFALLPAFILDEASCIYAAASKAINF